jgi:beta-galactosidase/beta-glucuronidase
MGKDAHSTSDQTQTNWNGVVGKMELRATDPVWIEGLSVTPDISAKKAGIEIHLLNLSGAGVQAQFDIEARCGERSVKKISHLVTFNESSYLKTDLPLGTKCKLWDEFSPNLYTLTVNMEAGERKNNSKIIFRPEDLTKYAGQAQTTFGLRQMGVTADKKQVTMNGRPFYVRGTLDCCIYPITGYPPTDVAAWKREIGIC